MQVLDAFKLKEFDLEPIFAAWTDPPRFLGNPKKDLPVDTWLDLIKEGCVERKVPKEYWHKVGQRFLGDKARTRLDELKAVLRNLHGGKYRWNWKRFKVAMRNMGWDIDDMETEWINVQSKPSGLWWIVGRKEKQDTVEWPEPDSKAAGRKQPERKKTSDSLTEKKSSSGKMSRQNSTGKDEEAKPTVKRGGWLSRSPSTFSTSSADSGTSEASGNTTSSFWSLHSPARTPPTSAATSVVPSPAQTPGEVTTTVAQAPLWLLNACTAFDFLNTEHPKVMTTLSAVLITVGSLPAIPAISAGAGGAILASHAVQAAGAIAVGVGNWLKASQDAAAAKAVEGSTPHGASK